MNNTTIALLVRQMASAAVGSSTLRGQGTKGVVVSGRESLMNINIKKYISVSTQAEFLKLLDEDTTKIMKSFPVGGQNWGAARKIINIFFRNLIYNKHICKAYKIAPIEKLLEVPLDSHVARGLLKTTIGRNLPRWHSIKRLTKKESEQYQKVAALIAKKLSINTIDLDIYLWRKLGENHLGKV